MKRIKISLSILAMLVINITTIKAIETTAIRYGGNLNDLFYDVILEDANFVAVGSSKSTNIEGLNNIGAEDAVIVKYDQNDNIVWQKNYGTTNCDNFNSVISVEDGYLVAGVKNIQCNSKYNGSTAFILKYNENGDLVKELEYKKEETVNFRDIIKTQDGNYVVLGEIYRSDFSTPVIIKYNQNGEIIFEKEITEYQEYITKKIIETENGEYIIIITDETTSTILNISSDGNILWESEYNMDGEQRPIFEDVIYTSKNTYMVVGGNHQMATASGASVQDLAFMIEYDKNGNQISETIFKRYKQSRFNRIIEIDNRYVVIAQVANLKSVDVSNISTDSFEVKIFKFDYEKRLRDETITGVKTTYDFYNTSFSVAKLTDNDYFIVLNVIGDLLDSKPQGNRDAAILKAKSVFGIEPELPLDEDEFKEVEVPDTFLNITSVIIIGILLITLSCLSYFIRFKKKKIK